jgi:hypothetical protein
MSTAYDGVGPGGDGKVPAGEESLGKLVSDLSNDLSTLLRKEVELAKAEVRLEVSRAGKGAGMLGGAGFAGWMVAAFASLALTFALSAVIPAGWAALITTALWAIVGGVLFVVGRKTLKQVNLKPEQTAQTLKEDVQWAKAQKN